MGEAAWANLDPKRYESDDAKPSPDPNHQEGPGDNLPFDLSTDLLQSAAGLGSTFISETTHKSNLGLLDACFISQTSSSISGSPQSPF